MRGDGLGPPPTPSVLSIVIPHGNKSLLEPNLRLFFVFFWYLVMLVNFTG